ncbi:hypothetical protein AKJ36_00245 [candidate division MSBL1 archaeon SCGC-AAA259I07]|uniref:Uncharacterized protein n=2 Tax=candidate division MSBL1 TaxID=215777 RepID=A0A133U8Z0_9EURY|nr:hypothetical protein AKJ61_00025 [candidate division MSBL1 archaeon SCGC-AAA259B11]KXA95510.1 hypothetical protein AKJ36_00245 [candidate division MSBL1 archaeon SCGC-AAA259I07]
MDINLEVDDEKIVMNKFVRKILTSMISSAVSNLQSEKEDPEEYEEIGENWQKIKLEITK